MSLSDYLLQEIRKTAERPTVEELLDRINRRSAARLRQSPGVRLLRTDVRLAKSAPNVAEFIR